GVNTLNGLMNLAGGTMNAPLTVASGAVLNWTAADLTGLLTVAAGGALTISNSVSVSYNYGNYNGGGSLTNNGTVLWAGTIYGYGGVLIHNAGLWQDAGDLLLGDGINSITNTFI